jgi:hypothetical protein
MRPDGVQRHDELAGDLQAVQVAAQEAEHLHFAVAQRVDEALVGRRPVRLPAGGRQQPSGGLGASPCFISA